MMILFPGCWSLRFVASSTAHQVDVTYTGIRQKFLHVLTRTGSSDAWCEGIKAEVEALNHLVKGPPPNSITSTPGLIWEMLPHLVTPSLPTDALA